MIQTDQIPADIIEDFETFLNGYVTEHKRALFKNIIKKRTRHLTVVLEDLYQAHNASAVLRSCDCFGIQDVHIIENKYEFVVTKDIALGSDKWLHVQNYKEPKVNNTKTCFDSLRDQGYRIVATSPHKDDYAISDLPIDQKTALVFGSEKEGLSDYALEHADAYVKIPMHGFSESFNISVSAAISLYELTKRLHKSNIKWNLEQKEQYLLYIEWMRRAVKYQEALETHFFENLPSEKKLQL